MNQHCLVAPKPKRMLVQRVIYSYQDSPFGDLPHDADFAATENVSHHHLVHASARDEERFLVERAGIGADFAAELELSPPSRASNPICANANFDSHAKPLAGSIFNPCKKLMTWNTRLCTSI